MVELLLLSNLPESPGRDGANYQSLKMVKAQDRCVAQELDDQVKAVLMHHTGIHQQRPWFQNCSWPGGTYGRYYLFMLFQKNTYSTRQSVRKLGFYQKLCGVQNKSVLLFCPDKGYWVRGIFSQCVYMGVNSRPGVLSMFIQALWGLRQARQDTDLWLLQFHVRFQLNFFGRSIKIQFHLV